MISSNGEWTYSIYGEEYTNEFFSSKEQAIRAARIDAVLLDDQGCQPYGESVGVAYLWGYIEARLPCLNESLVIRFSLACKRFLLATR